MAKQPAKPRAPRPRSTAAKTREAARDAVNQLIDEPDELRLRSASMGSEPNEEDIRLRAYHRYLERGGGHGLDFEDWLRAEQELKKP